MRGECFIYLYRNVRVVIVKSVLKKIIRQKETYINWMYAYGPDKLIDAIRLVGK